MPTMAQLQLSIWNNLCKKIMLIGTSDNMDLYAICLKSKSLTGGFDIADIVLENISI